MLLFGDVSQQMAVSRIVDFLRYSKLVLFQKHNIFRDEDRTTGRPLFCKAPGSCKMTGGLNRGDPCLPGRGPCRGQPVGVGCFMLT